MQSFCSRITELKDIAPCQCNNEANNIRLSSMSPYAQW